MFKRSFKIYVVSFFVWFGTLTRSYQGGQYSNTRSTVHQHWTRLSAWPTINHHEETSALGAARTTVPRNTSPLFYRMLFKFGAYNSYICICPNIWIHILLMFWSQYKKCTCILPNFERTHTKTLLDFNYILTPYEILKYFEIVYWVDIVVVTLLLNKKEN